MNDGLDDFDYESIIHGLDPDKVFAMGEHCGAKAFKDEALALLDIENQWTPVEAIGIAIAIQRIKNITT
jgi:hypothetical protein